MPLANPDYIATRIFHLGMIEGDYIAEKRQEWGLNRDQGRALAYIATHQEVQQNQLAKILHKSEASTTNMLKILEHRGLITRIIPEDNARIKLVSITEKGIEIDRQTDVYFDKVEQQLKDHFTAAELDQFQQLLAKAQQVVTKLSWPFQQCQDNYNLSII